MLPIWPILYSASRSALKMNLAFETIWDQLLTLLLFGMQGFFLFRLHAYENRWSTVKITHYWTFESSNKSAPSARIVDELHQLCSDLSAFFFFISNICDLTGTPKATNQARFNLTSINIKCLKLKSLYFDSQSMWCSDPLDIANCFSTFYSNLCNLNSSATGLLPTEHAIQSFLSSVQLP